MLENLDLNFIISYVPLIIYGAVILFYFFGGLIKGFYKTTRKLVYFLVIATITLFVTPSLTKAVFNFTIPSLNMNLLDFLIDKAGANEMLNKVPFIMENLVILLVSIISPLLYGIYISIFMILTFPIKIIYKVIANKIFRKQKYELEEDGSIKRGKRGKKVKKKYPKRAFLGGLVNAIYGALVLTISLLPINFISRTISNLEENLSVEGEKLYETYDFLAETKDILDYIGLYQTSIFSKVQRVNYLDKYMFKYLSGFKINNQKSNLESEINNITKIASILLKEDFVQELIEQGDINIEIIDLIDVDNMYEIIDLLKSSSFTYNLILETVNYMLEANSQSIANLFKVEGKELKLNYTGESFEKELILIFNLLEIVQSKKIASKLNYGIDGIGDFKDKINVETSTLILNTILDLSIIREVLPFLLVEYGSEFGVSYDDEKLNWEIEKAVFKNVLKAIYIVDDIGEIGDSIKNLSEENIEILGNVFHSLNDSSLFKNVIIKLFSTLLEESLLEETPTFSLEFLREISSWSNEIKVLKNIFALFEEEESEDELEKITLLLEAFIESEIILEIIPQTFNTLVNKIGDNDSISFNENIDEEINWKVELELLIEIIEDLRYFQDINMEESGFLSVEANRIRLGSLIEKGLASNLISQFINDKILDLLNSSFSEDGDFEITSEDLNNVSDWNNELLIFSKILDIFDQGDIDKESASDVLDLIDDSILLKDLKVDILLTLIKEVVEEEEYDEIKSIPKNSINYSLEKEIILDLINVLDIINGTTFSLETMSNANLVLIADVLDKIYNNDIEEERVSVIFVEMMTNRLIDIIEDAGFESNANDIKAVDDWHEELGILKDLANGDANNLSVAGYFILIESSTILEPQKINILVDAVKELDDNMSEEQVTAFKSSLTQQDYQYEKGIIIELDKVLDIIDDSNFKIEQLEQEDIELIGGVLNKIYNTDEENTNTSVLFDNLMTNKLLDIFSGEDIDSSSEDIHSVTDWVEELSELRDFVNEEDITISTFFAMVEASQLLNPIRESLLIDLAAEIDGDMDVTTKNQFKETQYVGFYDNEKAIFMDLEDDRAFFEGLEENFNLKTADASDINKLGEIIDTLSGSILLVHAANRKLTTILENAGEAVSTHIPSEGIDISKNPPPLFGNTWTEFLTNIQPFAQ